MTPSKRRQKISKSVKKVWRDWRPTLTERNTTLDSLSVRRGLIHTVLAR